MQLLSNGALFQISKKFEPTKNPRYKPLQTRLVSSVKEHFIFIAMGQEADSSTEHNSTATTSPENIDALLEAARYDDIEDVISLASAGVPLDSKDSQGRSALHMAAANGHLGIVEYLVDRGVDVNASNEEKNTPLHWACLNGHTEVAKKLVLSGANVSILNSHERTPIDEALGRGKMEIIDAINEAVAQVELSGATVS